MKNLQFSKKSIQQFESTDNWEENNGHTKKLLNPLLNKKTKITLHDVLNSRIALHNRYWFLANRVYDLNKREKLALKIFDIAKKTLSTKYAHEILYYFDQFIHGSIDRSTLFRKSQIIKYNQKQYDTLCLDIAFTELADAIDGAKRAKNDMFLRGDYVGNAISNAIENFGSADKRLKNELNKLIKQIV